MQHLQTNSTLQSGKYKIEKELGQGGLGITYLAEHCMLGGFVAIKEFFFKDCCESEEGTTSVVVPTKSNTELVDRFKQKFVKEAKTIFSLSHPNIVSIHDLFEENGTAYYMMEYIRGESLNDIVKANGKLSLPNALSYINKVADALNTGIYKQKSDRAICHFFSTCHSVCHSLSV